MKNIIIIILTSILAMSNTYAESNLSTYPPRPSVFILSRSKSSNVQFGKWIEIINSCIHEDKRSDDLSKLNEWQNIVIIDEGEYWAVSFHLLGNGVASHSWNEKEIGLTTWGDLIQDGRGFIVYLDKNTLQRVKPPAKALIEAPVPLKIVQDPKND